MNIEEQKLYSEIFSILIEKKKKEKKKKKKKKGVPSAYNKPRRIKKGEPGYGKKKFVVHARNKDGKTKVIRFGDANLEIKRDSKKRRDSFRARHKCDTANDILSAKYWSCKQWRKKSKVMDSKVFDPKSGKIITESVVVYEYIFENANMRNRYIEYYNKSNQATNFAKKSEALNKVFMEMSRQTEDNLNKQRLFKLYALLKKCKTNETFEDFIQKYQRIIFEIADNIGFQIVNYEDNQNNQNIQN